MALAAAMLEPDGEKFADAWNFGPSTATHTTVGQLAQMLVQRWGRGRIEVSDTKQPHEAKLLQLDCSKARTRLNWRPVWDVDTTVKHTVQWYKAFYDGEDVRQLTLDQMQNYQRDAELAAVGWATGPNTQRQAA
jgi:CDP-glucose 4,6-dehydratase